MFAAAAMLLHGSYSTLPTSVYPAHLKELGVPAVRVGGGFHSCIPYLYDEVCERTHSIFKKSDEGKAAGCLHSVQWAYASAGDEIPILLAREMEYDPHKTLARDVPTPRNVEQALQDPKWGAQWKLSLIHI